MANRRRKPARCYVTVVDVTTGQSRGFSARALSQSKILQLLTRGDRDALRDRTQPAGDVPAPALPGPRREHHPETGGGALTETEAKRDRRAS